MQGFNQNCENVIFIESKKIQDEYKEAFNNLWHKLGSTFVFTFGSTIHQLFSQQYTNQVKI